MRLEFGVCIQEISSGRADNDEVLHGQQRQSGVAIIGMMARSCRLGNVGMTVQFRWMTSVRLGWRQCM
jgi:hypothetical protein